MATKIDFHVSKEKNPWFGIGFGILGILAIWLMSKSDEFGGMMK
ncbi:MAG: hypothetical protein SCH70_13915 [Candidatus Methanoperedens sp.]|nr:hypothetical protein [Candidatus Methanoperedens sp.]